MIKHNQYKKVFLIVAIVSHICGFIAIADELRWGKWQWEEMGYVDCEVRFASNTSECGERGKTRVIIIEARDIPTAYQLYLRKYGKTHQKSGYALERNLPAKSHNYVVLYEMPLDMRYSYAYLWSDDRSSLNIDFWLGVCKSSENTCAKARLTFIDMSKEHSEVASGDYQSDKSDDRDTDKNPQNPKQNLAQDSTKESTQKSAQDKKSQQDSKGTSFSGLDSKIISLTTKQNTKNAKPPQNKIKIIATVW